MKKVEFSNTDEIKYNYSLKRLQYRKKAGNVSKYYRLDLRSENIDDDLNVISELLYRNEPFVVFGKCTNLYVTERGYDGVFIEIVERRINGIAFDEQNETFTVKADCFLKNFVLHAASLGYDFTTFYGILGLVGSAVCGNSGNNSIEIGKYVELIRVYDIEKREYKNLIPHEFIDFFKVRNSYINEQNKDKTRYIIMECVLKANYIGKQECESRISEKCDERYETDKESDRCGGTAGSFWAASNLPKEYLNQGKKVRDLIEESGIVTANFNGARYVTKKWFLTTAEETRDSDVAELLSYTIKKLKSRYNFEPQNEVVILDYDGKIDAKEFIKRYKI